MNDERRLDLEQIRALIALAVESDIVTLEVESPHLKVKIKKAGGRAASVAPAEAPGPAPDRLPAPEARYAPIIAPMVGTFYRAASPGATPFVQEGDVIEVGQTVCILEAMKLFNEIQSEIAGRVASVLVENGAPVEYGQPLFLIDPSA
jgi:acetyl-CoA carboxylase biotin carboxyl carrier protein